MAALRRRPSARDHVPWSMLRLAVLVGVMELVGTISYARGAEVGLVSIVTAASATYPLIPVLGGSSSCTSARSRPSTSASRW